MTNKSSSASSSGFEADATSDDEVNRTAIGEKAESHPTDQVEQKLPEEELKDEECTFKQLVS